MRVQDLPPVILRKFRTPSTWGAVLIFGLVWGASRLFIRVPGVTNSRLEYLVPFVLAGGLVTLAPLPWLWTGDDRFQASHLRGFLQALPWNVLWIGGCFGLLEAFGAGFTAIPSSIPRLCLGHYEIRMQPEWLMTLINLPFALLLGWFLADKERIEAMERESRRLANLTKAQVLQAQLNPHALFNVLAGLTELIYEDPDAAEEALVGLVDFYRHMIKHSTAYRVPLSEERRLLRRYLGIEEIRLGDRLQVEWVWPSWADVLELPPLLLQPLVENAVKHGVGPAADGGKVRVSVLRDTNVLLLRVANTGLPLEPGWVNGTGLGNLRERLTLLPAWKPVFRLFQEPGWTVAELALDWNWSEKTIDRP